VQAITGCLSAFEQYHALRAAQGMLPALDAEHRRRLAAAIQSQREEGGHIRPGTDRWALSERILASTSPPTETWSDRSLLEHKFDIVVAGGRWPPIEES
jgi:hypothetical protein